jgi:hypothetical protein
MRTHPAIAAMRRDRAPQRRAQAAMATAGEAWRAKAANARVLAEFVRFGAGARLADCPALLGLFTDDGSARRWIAGLVNVLSAALAAEPFGHPPFRHGYDRCCSTLLLARSGRAQLVLYAVEPGDRSFGIVRFADGHRREAVLAGKAQGRTVTRRGSGLLDQRPMKLEAGVRLALALRRQSLQVLAVERRLVALRLHRDAVSARPTREYDLSSGALLRQAAGDIRTSRIEMMLALLGRMGRSEAVPTMAEIACEPGDASLRWQALRECLALDTAAGLAALGTIAEAAHDPLAQTASALRAELLETYPELAALSSAPCLA